MTVFRLGLAGLGGVAEAHLDGYARVSELRVVAGADPSRARADVARKNGFAFYADAAEMIACEELNGLAVLTPASTHAAVVLQGAGAGLPVLCEKPLSIDIASVEAMIAACDHARVPLVYAASYRFLPAITAAKRLIDEGAIGDVTLMRETVVGGNGPGSSPQFAPIHYPHGGPGGTGLGLVDHGIHLIDIFGWFARSTPVRIFGRGQISGAPQHGEWMTMEYASGATAHLVYDENSFSTDLPVHGCFAAGGGWSVGGATPPGGWCDHPGTLHVHGTAGALRILHYANQLYLRNAAGIRQIALPPYRPSDNFAEQIRHFIGVARGHHASLTPPEIGLAALRSLLSVYAPRPADRAD